ncbi:polyprenol monophosphomannose synthase [Maribacter dokdonensis]|uniref:polyprenol monophosphomannose synthase n=1 Tax=Maribacter dokdonensis TaxID=320912 RepID=UPI002732A746|nr:polyprenol monophosphomannose synthase [Maribacter dokdonensis]MDP2527699.1 polyprenol monophosphomannose synthase [Maribacter dokdonensis]
MKNNILIIVPTYNEIDNIKEILKQIYTQLEYIEQNKSLHVLIVDDSSPDGTADLVKELQADNYKGKLHLIEREGKLGLGTAYITGFKWAIKNNYDYVFEMDADLSHNPKYLPDFLERIKTSDLVLGTRYMKGGGVVNWGKHRILISKGGNLYSKIILGLPYRDLTGGYKCFSVEVLKTIDLDSIISNGYAFQIELTYRAHLRGFKISETPIIFHDRIAGKSKLSNNVFTEAVKNIILLRLKKNTLTKEFKNLSKAYQTIESIKG